MRKSTFRLYLPFLALIAAQALLVTVLPSQGAKNGQTVAAGVVGSGNGSQGGAVAGEQVASGSTDAGSGVGGTGSVGGTGGSGGSRTGTGGTGGSGGGNVSVVDKNGDVTHCKGNKQFVILSQNNPPCVPKFVGDNGGSTYQGVTKDKITVVFFDSKPNDQVDAILATQGLAVAYPERVAFRKMAVDFVMKHYELYGRKIDAKFYLGNCPTTPPDYDACNAEAKAVIAQYHPFMIIWGTPLYGSVFDIWANAKIPSFGGWQFDATLFNNRRRRGLRYDPWMDGTQVGAHVAEYFCKKMAKGMADHSGAVIHPTIGSRGRVPRKLGVITPEIEANVLAK